MLADKHWGIHAPLRGCILPCSAEAAILAIEAEARAAPDPAPLDVDEVERTLLTILPQSALDAIRSLHTAAQAFVGEYQP